MGLMTFLMLSCRKATALTERKHAEPLSTSDRMRLWMHLGACAACTAYAKQSAVIDRLLVERDMAIVAPQGDGLEKGIVHHLGELRNAL